VAQILDGPGSPAPRLPHAALPLEPCRGRDDPAVKLLVVDDEPDVGRTMARAAEACGCETALARSAQGFLTLYDRDPPDVVLLDLSLPGGDGIELLRALGARRSAALILICSGVDGRVVDAAVRLGAALGLRMGGALGKPFTVRALADALARGAAAADAGDGHALCAGS